MSSKNNGGTTDYYAIPKGAIQCQDIIEMKEMNFSQGEIFKASWCLSTGRHNGTNYARELNKIIWYANRELSRISEDEEFYKEIKECVDGIELEDTNNEYETVAGTTFRLILGKDILFKGEENGMVQLATAFSDKVHVSPAVFYDERYFIKK